MSRRTYQSTAPAKLILFGEHSVVYGELAIASALSSLTICCSLTCTSATDDDADTDAPSSTFTINLPDLKTKSFPNGLHVQFEMRKLNDFIVNLSPHLIEGCKPPSSELLACISDFINAGNVDGDLYDGVTLQPIQTILYLYISTIPSSSTSSTSTSTKNDHCLEVTITSKNLPIGSGLGSSSAFNVSLSAVFLLYTLSNNTTQPPIIRTSESKTDLVLTRPNQNHLETINIHAYNGEHILHGSPSGLDNTISTYGGGIKFKKRCSSNGGNGDGGVFEYSSISHLKIHRIGEVLITNTNVARSTKVMVDGVRLRRSCDEDGYAGVIRRLGEVSEGLIELLTSNAAKTETDEDGIDQRELNTLITTAQTLLSTLEVSHPSLDLINSITNSPPFNTPSKLTGAGGGGCAFTVISNDLRHSDEKIEMLLEEAIVNGGKENGYEFTCLKSEIGGDGVMWGDV